MLAGAAELLNEQITHRSYSSTARTPRRAAHAAESCLKHLGVDVFAHISNGADHNERGRNLA
jgi:hypothetical protein